MQILPKNRQGFGVERNNLIHYRMKQEKISKQLIKIKELSYLCGLALYTGNRHFLLREMSLLYPSLSEAEGGGGICPYLESTAGGELTCQ